jgi:hypothetical protein
MKKTAVGWFEQQLDNLNIEIPFGVYNEAMEMEKQQIINSYETAMETDVYTEPLKTGEQYYNQTFKN